MLQQSSSYRLDELEVPLRNAADRHGAELLAVTNLGGLLRDHGVNTLHEVTVFALGFPEIYGALLAADVRFAAFLPWRIAACSRGEGVTLETLSPIDCCHMLNRPDLDRLVLPLETALRGVMDEFRRTVPRAAAAVHGGHHSSLGATEDQMSLRGALPQRIDRRGTKVEDLAGTGQHDSSGG